jgi:hypothetical protein
MILAKPGISIMLFQLGGGLLSGISITFLQDADGSFVGTLSLDRLIVTAFIQPVKEGSPKFIPLYFVTSAYHFLSPANRNMLKCII